MDELARCHECPLQETCPVGPAPREAGPVPVPRVRGLGRGEFVYRPGDAADGLRLVRSGVVKTFSPTRQGGEHVKGFFVAGDIIDYEALERSHHTAYAQALTASSVCLMDRRLLFTRAGVRARLIRLVSRRIQQAEAFNGVLATMPAERRIGAFVATLAERLSQSDDRADPPQLPLSHRDIANHLGVTVETVSRAIGQLQSQGWLAQGRCRITVTDTEGLGAYAWADPATGDPGLGARRPPDPERLPQ